ncbi:MAG: hypothetical protein R3A78_12305 [Polyangiales bacterium]
MSNAPDDFIDIVRCLREATCEFIVVGAYALAANGYPRATQDLDILVSPTPANAASVLRALTAFGAPIDAHGITAKDFETPGNVYQIGLPPIRIDILTSIEGVTFAEAVADHVEGDIGGEPVRFIGREAQIRNKRATGRTKDAADAEALEALR